MRTRFSVSTSGADRVPTERLRSWLVPGLAGTCLCAIFLSAVAFGQGTPTEAGSALQRAMADFRAGRLAESVAGFDRVAKLAPKAVPELWQRGIALYYVNRFPECRDQFDVHRSVNPADVENAAWHYLCVARSENPGAARRKLLPVRTDPREPMREIYLMFAGRLSPESVLVAGVSGARARFYAALYVGLYLEAQGEADRAAFYIRAAAADEFSEIGGYMHDVARMHMQVRKWPPKVPRQEPEQPASSQSRE